MGNLPDAAVLAVFTARPEFNPEWIALDHVTLLDLARFEPSDGKTLIDDAATAASSDVTPTA